MNSKSKHITSAYLLMLLFLLPQLWQLEHVFDNDHGIVYHSDHAQIQTISNQFCGQLHKTLKFHSLKPPVVDNLDQPQTNSLGIKFSAPRLYLYTLVSFHLRAPPTLI